jgi:drug/metabolite transporter (DMT)-like permease
LSGAAEPGSSHWRLYSLIGCMTLLWSINYVAAKIALRELPALFTTGLRNGLAGLLMIPVYAVHRRNNGAALWRWADVPVLVALGMCGVALNQIFFILGIAKTNVAHASIMIAMTPMLVLLLAAAQGQEKIGVAKVIGMATAASGVAILQLSRNGNSGATVAGDVFVFLAAFTFAIFSVSGKRVTGRFSNITLNTFAYCCAGVVLIPITIWSGRGVQLEQVSPSAWTAIAYMAVFPSVVCYLIYYYALGQIPASRVSAFSYLQPLIAIVIALPVLGERPTSTLLMGGAFVLTGVFVTERF